MWVLLKVYTLSVYLQIIQYNASNKLQNILIHIAGDSTHTSITNDINDNTGIFDAYLFPQTPSLNSSYRTLEVGELTAASA